MKLKLWQKIGLTYSIISAMLVIPALPLKSLGFELISDIIMYNATACLIVGLVYMCIHLIKELWTEDLP